MDDDQLSRKKTFSAAISQLNNEKKQIKGVLAAVIEQEKERNAQFSGLKNEMETVAGENQHKRMKQF